MNRTASGMVLAGLGWAMGAGAAQGQSCYQWHEVGPGPAVTDTWNCAMAYFPPHDSVMLFDGKTGEQFEWDGLAWTLVGDLDGIVNNLLHPLLCYDPARGVLVLVNENFSGLVYEWDGGPDGWELTEPAGDPLIAGRTASVVYDEARAEMLFIFDGFMHRYDGVTNTTETGAPPFHYGAAAYDPVRERVVYFGGFDANNQESGETWEWDGQAWTPLGVSGPSARGYHTMTYDPARGTCLLVGGSTDGGVSDEIWEWNGQTWSLLLTDGGLGDRYRHVAAFDERFDEMLVFGGVTGGGHDTTLFRRVLSPGIIVEQPESLTVGEGQFAAFSVTAAGQWLGYQWLKDGVEIPGATGAGLRIAAASLEDDGEYTVRITGLCGEAYSDPASLTVTRSCPPDFNGDGTVDTRDVLAFLNGWTVGCP